MVFVVFAGVGVLGLAWTWAYKTRPGPAATAPVAWPAGSHLPRDVSRPTLVLFAHPRCACTRSSLWEIRSLVSRRENQFSLVVAMVLPEGVPDSWRSGDIWDSARDLGPALVLADEGGKESDRFGVHTSGQVLLYDAGGKLRFSGGITPGRGHAGRSPELEELVKVLDDRNVAGSRVPVYGCLLEERP